MLSWVVVVHFGWISDLIECKDFAGKPESSSNWGSLHLRDICAHHLAQWLKACPPKLQALPEKWCRSIALGPWNYDPFQMSDSSTLFMPFQPTSSTPRLPGSTHIFTNEPVPLPPNSQGNRTFGYPSNDWKSSTSLGISRGWSSVGTILSMLISHWQNGKDLKEKVTPSLCP